MSEFVWEDGCVYVHRGQKKCVVYPGYEIAGKL